MNSQAAIKSTLKRTEVGVDDYLERAFSAFFVSASEFHSEEMGSTKVPRTPARNEIKIHSDVAREK
jgi:hypothetical protein